MAIFQVWITGSLSVEVPDESAVDGADPNAALQVAVEEELALSSVDDWKITEWAVV